MDFVELAHGFQGVEQALLGYEVVAEGDRHTLDHHIGGILLDPGFQLGLKGIAVRAGIPEELDHLDLAGRCLYRHALVQRQVVRAILGLFLGVGRQGQAGCCQRGSGAEGKIASLHVSSLLESI
jgi:hypothetical protein